VPPEVDEARQSEVAMTHSRTNAKRLSVLGLLLMIVGSVGMDQVTKIHAQDTLMEWSHATDHTRYQRRRHLVASYGSPAPNSDSNELYFALATNYVRNLGAAWGFLANLPSAIRVPFFYVVTIVAVVIIGMYLRATPWSHRCARFSLTLILSGAIGNFIDRLIHGYVIDWIDVRWQIFGWRYNFPNFNIADSVITVGVVLLMYDMVVLETIRRKNNPDAKPIG
jgi:signal peptidase II